MKPIEQQVEAFRIRMLAKSHDLSKLCDLIEEDIRAGGATYDPDTEILVMAASSGEMASMKVTNDGFVRVA